MLTDVYVEYLNGCLRRSARSSHHDIGRVTGSSVSHTAKIPPGVRIGRPGLFQFFDAAPAPIISRILNWALAKGRSFFFWRPVVCPVSLCMLYTPLDGEGHLLLLSSTEEEEGEEASTR